MNKSFSNAIKSITLIIISILGSLSFIYGQIQVIEVNFKDNVSSVYKTFSIATNNTVKLLWNTDTSTSQDYFEVERSFDKKNFSTAGIVLGPELINDVTSKYSFKDAAESIKEHHVIYYRLKQISADGTFTYSSIKTINIDGMNAANGQSANKYMDKIIITEPGFIVGKVI